MICAHQSQKSESYTARLPFGSTKKRKVATKTSSYEIYGEILFQKVASGYLLHFVQDGSSKNVFFATVRHKLSQKITRPRTRTRCKMQASNACSYLLNRWANFSWSLTLSMPWVGFHVRELSLRILFMSISCNCSCESGPSMRLQLWLGPLLREFASLPLQRTRCTSHKCQLCEHEHILSFALQD